MRQANNFGDGLFGLGKRAESPRIEVGVDLLDQLEGHEVEDEGLLVEDHDHHVLAELDVHNELVGVESDLRSVFLLVVVPDDDLVPLLLVDKHDHVRLIHHLHQGNLLSQILHFLLQSRAPRVVLQDLEPGLGRNCEVLLRLVRRDGVDLWLLVFLVRVGCTPVILLLHGLLVRLLVLLNNHFIDDAVLGGDHVPLLIDTLLHVRLVLLSSCSGLIGVLRVCSTVGRCLIFIIHFLFIILTVSRFYYS